MKFEPEKLRVQWALCYSIWTNLMMICESRLGVCKYASNSFFTLGFYKI